MRFTTPFALFAIATAAPTLEGAHADAESLLSSISSVDLAHDDVILFGVGGKYQVLKDAEFQTLKETGVLTYGAVDTVVDTIDQLNVTNVTSTLQARDCPGLNTEIHVTSQTDFLDWDVQMSAVFGAQQAPVLIAVAHGYQVANQVTFGGGIDFPVKAIGVSLKADYTKTWTTIDTTTITYTVPIGYYGTIISQPWTHRVYGNVYKSCGTDNWQKGTFMANSHTNQNYGGMNWVTGVMRLCASKVYPVPYCEGSGVHH